MRVNWIMAWAMALAIAPAAIAAVYVAYALAMRRYGLLPAGGAL